MELFMEMRWKQIKKNNSHKRIIQFFANTYRVKNLNLFVAPE